jgi:hypothetical protein
MADASAPQRTQRRVDTTLPPGSNTPGSAPENMAGPEGLLPHERDQATTMTGGIPAPEGQQAYKDLQRGLQDTDKGPPSDRAYQKQKR